MPHRLSLDFLTAATLPAADQVHLAADLGIGRVSILLTPVLGLPDPDLMADGPAARALTAALQATGVAVDMAEPFYITPDLGPEDLAPLLDRAAHFGARCVNLLARTPDHQRLADQFHATAQAAQSRGMTSVTEISKRGSLMSLADSAAFLHDHDLAVGIELDALHFFRAGGQIDQIAPHRDRITRVQICDLWPDMTPEAEPHEALHNRALPGQGVADIAGFLRACPRDVPIGLEIPQPHHPPHQAARLARDTTLALLGDLP